MDAGHLQTVGGEPLVDLVRPGDKDILGRRLHLPRGAQVQPHQAGQLIFTRNRAVSCQARLHPRPDVSTDCLPRQSRTASYLPLTLTGLPAAYTSAISTLDTSLYAIAAPYIKVAAMVANQVSGVVPLTD